MSRIIKFRSFNKQTGEMIYETDKNFVGWGIGTDEVVKWLHFEEDDIKIGMFIGELMQYTGLKDKNEIEIYESDIVAISYKLGNRLKVYIGVVEWKGYSDGEYVDNVECWMAADMPISECEIESIEVIGNIYINPELLKDL